jgi:hypothetical protein
MLDRPLGIYINWSSYDELSDAVQLTEDLAMAQFEHLLRLRAAGARLDAYLMDCFWYEPGSAYRRFRKPHWRDDGERWLAACKAHGVLPGLWFGCNSAGGFAGLAAAPAWKDSIDPTADPRWASACLFQGGFLADFMAALDHWYGKGVRVFKLDFLALDARLGEHQLSLLQSEVRALNAEAFRTALRTFRRTHPEAIILAYNGFEENGIQSGTDFAPRKTLDHRWLEAVDAFYSGDPRPADVPAWQFWRSKDVYSDHLVRAYHAQGFAPAVIDNAGFMIGTTGTCYHRGTEAWKGMLLLSLARGGWANTYYGNLDLLDDADAAWFAKAQALWFPLQRHGTWSAFGDLPGTGAAYGFSSRDGGGALHTVVNAGQSATELDVPGLGAGRVLFADAGFAPVVRDGRITLGPEQMAVVAEGAYAVAANDLGVQADVVIPQRSAPLAIATAADGHNAITGTVTAPATGRVRVIMRQRENGKLKRTTGGAPPTGTTMAKLLTLAASQGGRPVAVDVRYDKAIWSGLSWAVGEIPCERLRPGEPLLLRATSSELVTLVLSMEAWLVE